MMPYDRENQFAPGKLWSLWDLMARLKSDAIFRGLCLVSRLDQKWKMERAGRQPFEPHQFGFILSALNDMSAALLDAGLPISAKHAIGVVQALEQATQEPNGDRVAEGASRSLAEHHLDRLVAVVSEEAETKFFVSLLGESAHLYEASQPPFGEDVDRVFSVAIDDIRHAGNCLALGQATATIFHLMRVLEAGFKAVASELGLPYQPSWESYERKLKTILDTANYKNLTEDQKRKRPFYDQVLSDLNTIKMVWRNPTMHIVKNYDVEQARLIYSAVKIFMEHLAENLDPVTPFVISTGPDAE